MGDYDARRIPVPLEPLPRVRRGPSFLLTITGVGVSVGLTLLLGEVLVRVFDIGPTFRVVYREVFQLSDNPVLEYELRPGARDGQQRLNSAGFRDREFPRAKPDGVFRIAAIGDSLTYAASLPRRASYAKQLEELLNAYAT